LLRRKKRSSQFATGALDDLRLGVYGQHGALQFNLMDPNWPYVYDPSVPDKPLGSRRGWTRVETVQRYPGAVSPPARSSLGWSRTHAQNLFAFLTALVKNEEPAPGLIDGLRVHQVLDAAYASAAAGTWVEVEK
jgi:predicted dehydrogenase